MLSEAKSRGARAKRLAEMARTIKAIIKSLIFALIINSDCFIGKTVLL